MRCHAVNTGIMYNLATLQPVSLGGHKGPQLSQGTVASDHPLEPPLQLPIGEYSRVSRCSLFANGHTSQY